MSENTMTKSQRIVQGSRNNSESIGASAAVVATWAFSTYAGITPPSEVVMSLGVLIGAISSRIKG